MKAFSAPLAALLTCVSAVASPVEVMQLQSATSPAVLATAWHASTYVVPTSAPVLIRGATLLTGTGQRLDASDVLMAGGSIVAVGQGLTAPGDARVIEARGLWVTPGLIDVHSHLGVEARPAVAATLDFNEMSAPVTAEAWAEHSVWAQDPAFAAALAAGVQ